MVRSRLRACAVAGASLALGLVCVPVAQATVFGLSDQHVHNLVDPVFAQLPIDNVRLVVPWNVALVDPNRVYPWLNAARDRGLEPLIAFEAAATDRCPDAPCEVPSISRYR